MTEAEHLCPECGAIVSDMGGGLLVCEVCPWSKSSRHLAEMPNAIEMRDAEIARLTAERDELRAIVDGLPATLEEQEAGVSAAKHRLAIAVRALEECAGRQDYPSDRQRIAARALEEMRKP